jgi:hypothetical protein
MRPYTIVLLARMSVWFFVERVSQAEQTFVGEYNGALRARRNLVILLIMLILYFDRIDRISGFPSNRRRRVRSTSAW